MHHKMKARQRNERERLFNKSYTMFCFNRFFWFAALVRYVLIKSSFVLNFLVEKYTLFIIQV